MRMTLPQSHDAETFTVMAYDLSPDATSPAPPAPEGVTFSGVAVDIVPTPTLTFEEATPATVCLSTAGTRGAVAVYRLTTATDSAWEKIGDDTDTHDNFVCGTTTTFSQFAVGTTPPEVPFDNTLDAQLYFVGQEVALTLPTAAAADNTGMLTYTLTPTASIPTGLTFDPEARTLVGIPITVTPRVPLTYTAIDINDTTVINSLLFTVTVVSGITRLNEQILTRAASAMTASTLAAVAARVESAAGGGRGSGKPLAFELDGRTSLHGLLEKNGKAMLEDTMDYQRLLNDASFVLPLSLSATSAGDDASAGTTGETAVWGSSDFRNLADDEDGIDWDGKTRSTHLGIDKRLSEQALAGLALSWNDASFDYADDADNSTVGQGEYQYSVVTINPYFGWSNDGLKLWGTAGFGQGEITIDQEDGEEVSEELSTDTTQLSVAGGFNHRLIGSPGRSLHIKGDVALTQVAVEAKAGESVAQDFTGQDVESSRLRLLLSGEQQGELVSGGTLTPSLEVGARFDGGDGTTGTGFEIGGGLRYANPSGNVAAVVNIRTLLAGEYDEWGADFVVRLSPQSGQGLSLTLHPVWGKTQSVADKLWDDGASEITSGDTALRGSVDTEVGYGLAATMFGSPGLLTPYTGMTAQDGGSSRLRLGGRFVGGNGLSLNLEGAQKNTTDSASHQVLLRGEVAF